MMLLAACGPGSTEVTSAPSTTVTEQVTTTTVPPATTAPSTTVAPSTTTTEAGVSLASSGFLVPFQILGAANWTLYEQGDFLAEITSEGPGDEGERDKIYFTTLQPDGAGLLDVVSTSPHFEAGDVTATEVGGVPAEEINVRLLPGLSPQATGCSGGSGACMVLALDAATSTGLVIREGMAYRVWVVDVGVTPVTIVAEAQEARFGEWTQAVEESLPSLTWQG
jgi:hypothetical protein